MRPSNINLYRVAVIIFLLILGCDCGKRGVRSDYLSREEDTLKGDANTALNFRDKQLKIYSDSLNAVVTGDDLPVFLENYEIDFLSIYWDDMHHPISVRSRIINGCTNEKALDMILSSVNPKYDIRPIDSVENTFAIPLLNLSLREMVKKRKTDLH